MIAEPGCDPCSSRGPADTAWAFACGTGESCRFDDAQWPRHRTGHRYPDTLIGVFPGATGARDLGGGHGASFALPSDRAAAARQAFACTAAFVVEVYGLKLRVAEVPVAAIRAAGFDIRVARFAASPDLNYAMFSGGGLAWAETRMKAGEFSIPPGPLGCRPNLSGLSCRFEAMPTRRGVMLSIIVQAANLNPAAPEATAYRALNENIIRLVEESPYMARPMPENGPPLVCPPSGFDLEARAGQAPGTSLLLRRLKLFARTALSFLVLRLRIPVGRFNPRRYLNQLVANSDYRKYDDGLRRVAGAARLSAWQDGTDATILDQHGTIRPYLGLDAVDQVRMISA